ncbi:MAG: hypothetical protein AAFR68_22460 [Pseudomonadota bacterium]
MIKSAGVILFAALCASAALAEQHQEAERHPYEHVFRVTATLSFDGEIIEVDDLIDCRSDYDGPPERANRIRFDTSRWQLAYDTGENGRLVINIMPNACGAFSEDWAGVSFGLTFPEGWLPFMHWYDSRTLADATRGEIYWSAAALQNPKGRLKVVDGFTFTYPEQNEAIVAEAAAQERDGAVWPDPPRIWGAYYLQDKPLPSYLRLPRDAWANEPSYRGAPDRPSDIPGLTAFLDGLPHDVGLMYVGAEIIANEAWSFTVRDHFWGIRGGTTDGWHGVPQRGKPRWGMFLSDRAVEQMRAEPRRLPFRDELIPTEDVDGVLTLRPDLPGMAFMSSRRRAHWFSKNQLDFLGKEFANSEYRPRDRIYIFDTDTRDLWVNFQ